MERVDWIATVLAAIGTLVLTQIFPVLNGLWAILVFFVLAGLFGGFLRLRRGDARSSGSLSSTAKETLDITRRLATVGKGPDVTPEMLVRQTLFMAGHTDVSDRDVGICLWPDRTAALVAEDFYVGDRPLTRLQHQHVRSKWAALRGFNAVKMALLIAMADYVTPEQHALAVAWNAQIGGEAFNKMYTSAQEDIAEMRGRGTADPVATYAAAIYLRSILRDDCVDRYFPAETDAERAVADATTRISAATSELAAG